MSRRNTSKNHGNSGRPFQKFVCFLWHFDPELRIVCSSICRSLIQVLQVLNEGIEKMNRGELSSKDVQSALQVTFVIRKILVVNTCVLHRILYI